MLLLAFVGAATFGVCAQETEARVGAREFPTETRLVVDGRSDVLILYGNAQRALAEQLQSGLEALCGVPPPLMLDTEATAGRRWTLRDDVRGRNLIVLGDINTNRAMLALYAKVLAAASGRFPGPGRYVLRHLAEPFVPGRTAIVIGAGDHHGLAAGIDRLVALLRAGGTEDRPPPEAALGVPFLEFGGADGPVHVPVTGSETFRDYRDAAYVFYSGGRPPQRYAWFGPRNVDVAMRTAREQVLAESARDTPTFSVGGHYTFIPNYQALRLIIAHGLLSAEELRDLERKLVTNALAYEDSYVAYFNGRHERTMAETAGNPSRHSATTVVGQYLLLDYLMSFANLSEATRARVAVHYATYSKIIRDWSETHLFRARTGDLEALDCTAFMIYGFMHMGLEDFIDNGVLGNMANFYLNNVNNLWCDAGASHYIGAYRGSHLRSPDGGLAVRALAFFTGNRGLEFLDTQRFEQAGTYQRGFCDKARMCLGQPEPFALPAGETAETDLACPILRKTPIDPGIWRSTVAAAKAEGVPLPLTRDQAYDTIGFRDGWSADDAFLAVKGMHADRLWQVNAIVGHTEHGARFLFGGSQTHEHWYRGSVTVDTAEFLPLDAFARLDACVSTEDAGLIASTCARFNGTRWQRTIFRQRGAFFAVLDDLTADSDRDFRITATWRILPPGRIDEQGVFRAAGQNGARFAIFPGMRTAAEVTRPPVDGTARPTFYRQWRDARLAAGETVSFHNVIRARPPGAVPRVSAETVTPGNALRVGSSDTEDVVLLGSGRLPAAAGLPEGECAAYCLMADRWLLGGIRRLHLDGTELLRSSQPVDLVLDWNARAAVATNRTHDAATITVNPGLSAETAATIPADGEHTFPLRPDLPTSRSADRIRALPKMSPGEPPQTPAVETPEITFSEFWSLRAQAPSAAVIHPIQVSASTAPDTMAVHNLHDGFMWSSSIPAPVWRLRELVLTVDAPDAVGPITGLRVVGNVGTIEIEERQDNQFTQLPAEETRETLFAGYSGYRVGGTLYAARKLSFASSSRSFRVRLAAPDPDQPTVRVGEIQLLGRPENTSVWGRLLLTRLGPNTEPVLFCRTGTSVDTLERGGSLRALNREGQTLWHREESAPAQYREQYWLTADMDADGTRELVTYADDMVLRVFAADGMLVKTVDLHAWEGERQGKPMGSLSYGGKAIAAWPPAADGRPDLFVFGHVEHHHIRFRNGPRVIRRDRVPTWDCAPAASLAVNGWSGPGKQNLVGVAPYQHGVVLWEAAGPDEPPRLLERRPFDSPLVQPGANSQQPAFVACLPVNQPAGVVAVTPRGAQFFAAPDGAPGWVFAGACPTSAAAVRAGAGGANDLVYLGRENGRVLALEAGSGRMRSQVLLDGIVRRIIPTASGRVCVGTSRGLFMLDAELQPVARHGCACEDIAVEVTDHGTLVFALLTDGRLQAFRLPNTSR